MEIGVRDFPNQMGPSAPRNPPAPPDSISYAGNSGRGAPASSDFTGEANFGIEWLLKMWDDNTQTLYYQVDNTQDWDYYGEGSPASAAGNCGGTYDTPYCLITEYDIWTLPQAADNFQQAGDPQPCDPLHHILHLQSPGVCGRPRRLADQPESCRTAGRRLRAVLPAQPHAESRACQSVPQKRRGQFSRWPTLTIPTLRPLLVRDRAPTAC